MPTEPHPLYWAGVVLGQADRTGFYPNKDRLNRGRAVWPGNGSQTRGEQLVLDHIKNWADRPLSSTEEEYTLAGYAAARQGFHDYPVHSLLIRHITDYHPYPEQVS